MFALRSGQSWASRRRGVCRSAVRCRAGGFVLPRLLRRPARLLGRMNEGEFTPPPFAATVATAMLLAASGLYGAYVGGHFPALVQAITARTGFAVDQIRVSGHHETSEIDILDRLELDGWTSLIGFDAEKARERIAALPWVRVGGRSQDLSRRDGGRASRSASRSRSGSMAATSRSSRSPATPSCRFRTRARRRCRW